jgi:hypothetical protein
LFDLWVAINAYKIRKDQNLINSYSPTDRLPSKVWIWIKKLSKIGNLLSSAAWICYEVVVGVSSAPGKSTMALGILTGAASFIFLIADIVLEHKANQPLVSGNEDDQRRHFAASGALYVSGSLSMVHVQP